MARPGGMFVDGGVPGPRHAAELVVLSAAVREWVADHTGDGPSDMTGIRSWYGQQGRWAIMIDGADRMVRAWRVATRITTEDLVELLREAVFQRFGAARARAQGIACLSDHGPEHPSHRFRPFVWAWGLIPCHMPRRSPESNGLAERFFGSVKRDDIYQVCLETFAVVSLQVPQGIEHDNQQAPYSA